MEDPSARQARVLETALKVFVQHGYRKASMVDVAEQAGISRPGLYLYFATKEELFQACIDREFTQSLAQVEDLLSTPGRSLADRLVAAFDHWIGRHLDPGSADVGVLFRAGGPDLGE